MALMRAGSYAYLSTIELSLKGGGSVRTTAVGEYHLEVDTPRVEVIKKVIALHEAEMRKELGDRVRPKTPLTIFFSLDPQ